MILNRLRTQQSKPLVFDASIIKMPPPYFRSEALKAIASLCLRLCPLCSAGGDAMCSFEN